MHRDFLPQSDNNEPEKVMNNQTDCNWTINGKNKLPNNISFKEYTTYMVFLGCDISQWPLFAEEIPFVQ